MDPRKLLKLGIDIGQTSVAKYDEDHRRKAGRRFLTTMPTASRRWICSSCLHSPFACPMDC
jgi:hypothetical protein